MKHTGDYYEQLAIDYLTAQGLSLVTRHFRKGHWEIDLIMKEQDTLVFVEVKYRSQKDFGGAEYALSQAQISRLRRTAQYYLQTQQLKEHQTACRFDLLAVDGQGSEQRISWLKNAF
ncbi:YraN family protein [Neiella sp. HB171785]|uniref:UPF0102 protein IC617_10815 n=1 Tax=Neiella litorisoli TaxID=2771431 RepID=A0A8J6R352_9GAMM|nr:YraN family protein [Neiella litorisoli]MBD1389920.1 YraN family protein [Neiella litorisoli]